MENLVVAVRRALRPGKTSLRRRSTALAVSMVLANIVLVSGARPALALPADLDPTFAGNGVSIAGDPVGWFTAVAVQSDGKLVVGGTRAPGSNIDVQLVRYLPDGRLDPTFGDGGRVFSDFGQAEVVVALVIQPDGRIIVSGDRFPDVLNPQPRTLVFARYNADGSPDLTFGTAGHVITPGGSNRSLALQPDGKILVGEYGNGAAGMFRLNVDGSLDPSLNFTTSTSGSFVGVAVQPSGRILFASTTLASGSEPGGAAVRRFLSSGSLDPTFGSSGVAQLGPEVGLNDLAVQADGRILVAGAASSSFSNHQFRVTRLSVDGAPDASFGPGGQVTSPVGDAQTVSADHVVVGSDGALTVAGWASAGPGGESSGPNHVFMAHMSAAGVLDAGFGAYGTATYLVGGQPISTIMALALQADGKPVAVGSSRDPLTGRDRGFSMRLQGACAGGASPACAQPKSVLVAFNSGRVMDVPGNKSTPGMALDQWDWNGGANQEWRLEPLSNGAYRIVSVGTGMVIDVAGASKAEGAAIIQWPWQGGANQQWVVVPFVANQNVMLLVSMNSGLALEVSGGSVANGARLIQWHWNGGSNQIWFRATF